jgi:hypothetical protein
LFGTGVYGVDITIEVTIEGHGRVAGEYHTEQHHYQFNPVEVVLCSSYSQEKTDDRKRQCKYGVCKKYE